MHKGRKRRNKTLTDSMTVYTENVKKNTKTITRINEWILQGHKIQG